MGVETSVVGRACIPCASPWDADRGDAIPPGVGVEPFVDGETVSVLWAVPRADRRNAIRRGVFETFVGGERVCYTRDVNFHRFPFLQAVSPLGRRRA
jgi:hypothetical protein